MLERKFIVAAALVASVVACSAGGGNRSVPPLASDVAPDVHLAAPVSVLKMLTKQVVIGSTVDPLNGDQNPYGLALDFYASFAGSKLKKGNLYICNFNNKKNVQGTGTTIVTLAPKPGSKPQRFYQSASLNGCTANAIDGANETWTSAFSAKTGLELGYNGKVKTTFKGGVYQRPFGVAYSYPGANNLYPTTAVWTSDAHTGQIVLSQTLSNGYAHYPKVPIVSGFAVNNGKPGSILGPSGLIFDPYTCVKIPDSKYCVPGTLYVIDGVTNTIVAINNVLNLTKANSIVVSKDGKTFSGPRASWAKLIYAGRPLNGPISATVVYPGTAYPPVTGGNIVVGNTLDPAGKNLLIEISPFGKLLDTVNVDKGAAGALFGIASNPNLVGTKTLLYFNDDNANNVQVLEK